MNPTIYRKPAKGAQDVSSSDGGDDDGNDNSSNLQANTDPSEQVTSSKDHARSAYSVELGDDDDDDEDTFRAPKTDTEEQREEKLIIFLSDPEKSITIFLSSYMREQGLIWSVSLSLTLCIYFSSEHLLGLRRTSSMHHTFSVSS